MAGTIIPPPEPVGKKSFYRPELDALRFFAFFAVFLFHPSHPMDFASAHPLAEAANGLMQAGVFGVDLFFVLSAYLITELLLREKEERGALDVRAFYVRRMLRIWPLYFFYIGLALLPWLNPEHGFTWRYAAAFVLLSGNWSIIAFGWPVHSIIGPLWTVSIEEQFYLLWPPLVRTLSRDGITKAAVGMLVLSTATRAVMVAIQGGTESVWCNTLGRLDPIAGGILVAVILRGGIPEFRLGARLAMLFCGVVPLVLVANFWHINGPKTLEWVPTLAGFPVVAASCTLILLSALGIPGQIPQWLLYLGKISYGLYVYHALAIFLSTFAFPTHGGFLRLALRIAMAFALTVLMAAVSYAVLESPFLRLKKRFAHIDSRPV